MDRPGPLADAIVVDLPETVWHGAREPVRAVRHGNRFIGRSTEVVVDQHGGVPDIAMQTLAERGLKLARSFFF